VALIAAGIKKGQTILTPDFSFIATANSAKYIQARAQYVDIDEKTFNMDAAKTEEAIKKTNAAVVMPVSLYGQAYDADAIHEAARDAGAKIISDNCQAIGAEWRGKRNFGDD
ncbi:TPA: aminotransferase DegT, partial [Candidatus Micrarchaeota archaeon]|nr:aminotransferase DegT [Candidatus Micrarchaeota archaeon]